MTETRRHVIITGGSSGIGLATAKLFVLDGAIVSLLARDQGKLDLAAEETGAKTVISVDVTHRIELQAAIAEAERRHGPCDVLVTCAGIAHPGYFHELDDDIFTATMDTDYFGTLWAVRAVVPGMIERRQGTIVGVSSVVGMLGIYGYSAYAPAKFAVRGIMDTLRMELKAKGIHVACVYPADVRTPQFAYENALKPPETEILSATVNPIEAETAARAILQGIANKTDEIYTDRTSKIISRAGQAFPGILHRYTNRVLTKYWRKQHDGVN